MLACLCAVWGVRSCLSTAHAAAFITQAQPTREQRQHNSSGIVAVGLSVGRTRIVVCAQSCSDLFGSITNHQQPATSSSCLPPCLRSPHRTQHRGMLAFPSTTLPQLNSTPKQWANGIPPVMGAHLMASGTVAPISTSKGPGIDIEEHQFQYADEANAKVVVYATAKNAAAGLARSVVEAAAAAIKAKGSFTLVLSGESVGQSGNQQQKGRSGVVYYDQCS